MVKADKVENKDQKVEKSSKKKCKKFLFKKKESKEKHYKWYCLCAINI